MALTSTADEARGSHAPAVGALQAAGERSEPLADSFGRTHTYLRVSVTDRCNFRCRYCMPAEGLRWRGREEMLTDAEICRAVRIFAGLGVGKVRITGGEPTVRPGIDRLIARIAATDGVTSVHLTTNGHCLLESARTYRAAGLAGVNVSIDSLRPDRFAEITRRDELGAVLAGLDAALDAGIPAVKVNTVVMAGVNDDELLGFVELARCRPVSVRFIEFMPFRSNGWSAAGMYPYARMRADIERVHRLVPVEAPASAVARDFRIEGHRGSVGFIASMTASFCSGCNRVRLTADGILRPCLFSPGGVNVRALMRAGASDGEVIEAIRTAVFEKGREHPPMGDLLDEQDRSMVQIGG